MSGAGNRKKAALAPLAHPSVGAGAAFGMVMVVFSLAGYWLDTRFGTSPLLLLIGVGLGGFGGFVSLVETVSPGTLFKARKPRDGGPEGDGGAD